MSNVNAVGVIIENDDGQILVLLRNKNRPEGGTYGLVGGKVETNETRENACVREIKEEIDIDVDANDLIFLKSYIWDRPDIKINFSVYRLNRTFSSSNIQLQPAEADSFEWVSPKSLYKRPDLMLGLYDILKDHYKVG